MRPFRRVSLLWFIAIEAVSGFGLPALAWGQAFWQPFRISTAPGFNEAGSSAFDGTNYLVVWNDEGRGLYATRVSPDGAVLDRDRPIRISDAGYADHNTVVFDGVNYFIVWNERDTIGVYGIRVDTNGRVVPPGRIRIADLGGFPRVAFNGDVYLVVWVGTSARILGARVARDGRVIDTEPLEIARSDEEGGGLSSPVIASNGAEFFVGWEAQDGRGSSTIHGSRLSAEAEGLDPGGIDIATGLFRIRPDISFDGTNYLVIWTDAGAGEWYVAGARVSPLGDVLDPAGIAIATISGNITSVAFDGRNHMVVWTKLLPEDRAATVWATYVTPEGEIIEPRERHIVTWTSNAVARSVTFGRTREMPRARTGLILWLAGGIFAFDLYGIIAPPSP